MSSYMVPVGLSNRHVHLSKEHIEILFGKGYELTKFKDLSQPDQYAANEKIQAVGAKGSLEMRVLGPSRGATQIEISISDCFVLGVKPVIKDSGDHDGTPGARLVGPSGEVVIDSGVVVAARHIHMHTGDAENLGVKKGDIVRALVGGKRATIFENVLVRVSDDFALELHLDIDEGNTAALKNGQMIEVQKYDNI
jgi:putative phosphotransacetylase